MKNDKPTTYFLATWRPTIVVEFLAWLFFLQLNWTLSHSRGGRRKKRRWQKREEETVLERKFQFGNYRFFFAWNLATRLKQPEGKHEKWQKLNKGLCPKLYHGTTLPPFLVSKRLETVILAVVVVVVVIAAAAVVVVVIAAVVVAVVVRE